MAYNLRPRTIRPELLDENASNDVTMQDSDDDVSSDHSDHSEYNDDKIQHGSEAESDDLGDATLNERILPFLFGYEKNG